ncbi:unnamed protein product [Caenorhabditis angaria]|uniref:Major sperm protein n=1 Tax=Caenorhabditis angaria TaxID=860376 RepID=A0A9P1IHS3_9PELO|nr:unnamed protein product [Caenorhabditis angaria]
MIFYISILIFATSLFLVCSKKKKEEVAIIPCPISAYTTLEDSEKPAKTQNSERAIKQKKPGKNKKEKVEEDEKNKTKRENEEKEKTERKIEEEKGKKTEREEKKETEKEKEKEKEVEPTKKDEEDEIKKAKSVVENLKKEIKFEEKLKPDEKVEERAFKTQETQQIDKEDVVEKPKNYITVDKESLEFKLAALEQNAIIVTNNFNKKIMFKIKSSDNKTYSVNPVFGTIDPGKTCEIVVTHCASQTKEAKLVIVNAEFIGDGKDLRAAFQSTKVVGLQYILKLLAK